MPRNTINDLNNHLFEEMERLNDEELTKEQLGQEIRRAHAMSKIAQAIVANDTVALKALALRDKGETESIPRELSLDPGTSGKEAK